MSVGSLTGQYPGKLSAKRTKDGVVLYIILIENRKETWRLITQSEANAMKRNRQGEFEIP
jgi:hypothetical protein